MVRRLSPRVANVSEREVTSPPPEVRKMKKKCGRKGSACQHATHWEELIVILLGVAIMAYALVVSAL